MKATWEQNKHGEVRLIEVELSRRNLLALLAKLDGSLEDRAGRTRGGASSTVPVPVYVRAVENDEHYSERPPGVMHEDTERTLLARALDDPKARGGRHFSTGLVRAPLSYCSEGAYVEAETEECRKMCPGFSPCRDLGCQKLDDPDDPHGHQ